MLPRINSAAAIEAYLIIAVTSGHNEHCSTSEDVMGCHDFGSLPFLPGELAGPCPGYAGRIPRARADFKPAIAASTVGILESASKHFDFGH